MQGRSHPLENECFLKSACLKNWLFFFAWVIVSLFKERDGNLWQFSHGMIQCCPGGRWGQSSGGGGGGGRGGQGSRSLRSSAHPSSAIWSKERTQVTPIFDYQPQKRTNIVFSCQNTGSMGLFSACTLQNDSTHTQASLGVRTCMDGLSLQTSQVWRIFGQRAFHGWVVPFPVNPFVPKRQGFPMRQRSTMWMMLIENRGSSYSQILSQDDQDVTCKILPWRPEPARWSSEVTLLNSTNLPLRHPSSTSYLHERAPHWGSQVTCQSCRFQEVPLGWNEDLKAGRAVGTTTDQRCQLLWVRCLQNRSYTAPHVRRGSVFVTVFEFKAFPHSINSCCTLEPQICLRRGKHESHIVFSMN